MASKLLNELDDGIEFIPTQNGHRSDSCEAIEEVDEDAVSDDDLAPPVNNMTDEERKAAALRIIKRAKRAGLPRDRAYSTSEGIYPQKTNKIPMSEPVICFERF